ncbi:MAG: S8 family serine peptidase [Lactobacillaceae bacterium]|jgi:lactocepin|nr:S8 family serine peptidase [Lactobacillaceae bacterium]
MVMNKKVKKNKYSAIILTSILLGNLVTPVATALAEVKVANETPSTANTQTTQDGMNPFDSLKKAFDTEVKKITTKLTSSDQTKAKEYIIQLDEKPAAATTPTSDGSDSSIKKIEAADKKVEADQADEKKAIEKITDNKVEKNFTYLINGFKIKATPLEISEIKEKVDGISKVSEVQKYETEDVNANDLAQIQQVWESKTHPTKGEGMLISVIDTGMDPDHQDMVLGDSGKKNAKLSEEAVNNIVESGILHGKGKYYSDKVPYGYNYADGDDKILDNGLGGYHGHHVTGIVGANGTVANGGQPIDGITHVDGVAPEAQIMMMKACNYAGSLTSDAIIEGIEDSVKLGADVINMSIGSSTGVYTADDAEINAVEQAADAGVLSVVSAGNSGNYSSLENANTKNLADFADQRTSGTPAVAPSALSVAASYNSKVPYTNIPLLNSDIPDSLKILPFYGNENFAKFIKSDDHSADLVVVPNQTDDNNADLPGLGYEADYAGIDVKDKWAVVLRGDLTFSDKQATAVAHGAKGLIVINNVEASAPNGIGFEEGTDFAPTFSTTLQAGKDLLKYIGKGKTINFGTDVTTALASDPTAAKPTSFTSWGTGSDFLMKPEIMATGGNVWSTMNDNGYGLMSGTSMSSPFVAGSEALVLSQIKKQKNAPTGHKLIEAAKLTVQNTAVPAYDDENKTFYSPRRQGTGNIQVDDALKNKTVLANKADNTAGVSLKEIKNNQLSFTVTLTNYGSKQERYQLDDKYLTVAQQITTSTGDFADAPIAKTKLNPSKKWFTLKAGKSTTVTFTANLNKANKQTWVEGYVGFINAKTHKALSIPYFGYNGDYNQQAAVDKFAGQAGSKMNVGHISDLSGNLIGSSAYKDEKGVLRITGNDANDYWFSPIGGELENSTGNFKAFVPSLPLTRDVVKMSVKIYNSANQLVKQMQNTAPEGHAYLDNSSHTPELGLAANIDLAWTGTDETGANVPDGDYKYEISTTPAFTGAKAQKTTLKARIDRVAPEVSELKFAKNDDGSYHISFDMKDQGSGIPAKYPLLFGINAGNGTEPIIKTVGDLTGGQAIKTQKHIDFAVSAEELANWQVFDEDNCVYMFTRDQAGNDLNELMRTNADGSVTKLDADDIRSVSHKYELTADDVVVTDFRAKDGNSCFGSPIPVLNWNEETDRADSHPDLKTSEDLILHKDPTTRATKIMIYDRETKVAYQNTTFTASDGYYRVKDAGGKEDDWAVNLNLATSLIGDKPFGLHSLRTLNPKYEDYVDVDQTVEIKYNGVTTQAFIPAGNQHISSWVILYGSAFTQAGSEDPFQNLPTHSMVDEIISGNAGNQVWIQINGTWARLQKDGVGVYQITYIPRKE